MIFFSDFCSFFYESALIGTFISFQKLSTASIVIFFFFYKMIIKLLQTLNIKMH